MIRTTLCILIATNMLACASLQPEKHKVNPSSIPNNTSKILVINEWRLLGRLSIQNAKNSWLTSLEWRHDILTDDLTLSTSLGGVVAKLNYSDAGILVSDSEGGMRNTSEAELRLLLGCLPPLKHLRFWVRGIPNPEFDVQNNKVDISSKKTFEQDGWRVALNHFGVINGVAVPAKVSLSKNNLRIKLVVDKWLG